MNKLHQIIHYIKHQLQAGNAHALHSPFVYDLYTRVISMHKNYYCFSNIEALRLKLASDNSSFEKEEFGTGKNKIVHVNEVLQRAVKPRKQAQLLFRLINYFHSKNILEIGTSLGITTAYLASVDSSSRVLTLEGCTNTLSVAKNNFDLLRLKNITCLAGDFSNTLPQALNTLSTVDFVFFDGNHQYQASMDYFERCLTHAHEQSVFVFDDIYWSEGMTRAWKEIIQHPKVSVSIDLYHVGLIFFRSNINKQHHCLKF